MSNVRVHRSQIPPIVVETNVGPYFDDHSRNIMPPNEAVALATKIIQTALTIESHDVREWSDDYERYDSYERCPACEAASVRDTRPAHVYLFECGGRYKIGISDNVRRRMKQLDKRPFPLTLVACSEVVPNAYVIEQSLHERFDDQRLNGEWFELTDEQVEYITEYLNDLE